jgi:hypothetical protein
MTNVTVVTPVFNTQDYLHRCITSVLGQKGVTLRYIVIDDGSTDNSGSIARFYAQRDDRIVYVQTPNAGQGEARNVGIRLAESEYIYFVDSDDYLGEDTLRILYDQAKAHDLDICSPSVPKHYFDKPLEYVGCLPCKSQFIRLSIIKAHNIFQPSVRSGQDGVFSHLVLTHCRRIGMATDATFEYTHAREGSTFANYLKRHDAVPGIIAQHYAAIEAHYNQHGLWRSNALRLLSFVESETLKNRLDPHLPHLSASQLLDCFNVLCPVTRKAYAYLSPDQQRHVAPAVASMAKHDAARMAAIYATDFMGKPGRVIALPTNSKTKGKTLICEYADLGLIPSDSTCASTPKPALASSPAQETAAPTRDDLRSLQEELWSLRGKMDLSINTLVNATVQIVSAVHAKPTTLSRGLPDLVVSMTTLPARLHVVHNAVESVLAQSILPSRLVLWISDDVNADAIPPQLASLESRGLEIRRVRDVGPHTKLIYALREFADKSIVTVDDDVIYPTNALQCLWEQHLRFPQAVVSNWARELAFGRDGAAKGVREGKLLTPPLLEREIEQAKKYIAAPSLLAFPYGTAGVLYPPGALNEQVFDIETMKALCPKEDDIWFKAMSVLNGTPVVTTNLGINPLHHCLTGTQHVALRHDNHGLGENQKQMAAVFKHFALYPLLSAPLAPKNAK